MRLVFSLNGDIVNIIRWAPDYLRVFLLSVRGTRHSLCLRDLRGTWAYLKASFFVCVLP